MLTSIGQTVDGYALRAKDPGGELILSVEPVNALTLTERLKQGPIPLDEAVYAVLQLLATLGAAHAAGLIHRQLSSDHVLISPGNIIKLTGFSTATTIGGPDATRRGNLSRSTACRAPEVFQGQFSLDPRVDIYAAGCIFYELVTGRLPFAQTNEYELMMAHLRCQPVPPSQLDPSLNGLLDAVILKALQKHPDNRYQSAADFYQGILNPRTG